MALLRSYVTAREGADEEARVRALHGWPAHYDPCDIMETLRFAFRFRSSSTRASALLLDIALSEPNTSLKPCHWDGRSE